MTLLSLVCFYILGMCKHLHTALILAAARGYDVEEQRMQKAASLLQNSAFNLDYPFLTVFDESMAWVWSTWKQ